MGQVEPPPSRPSAGLAFLGGLIGLIASVAVSLGMLGLITTTTGTCPVAGAMSVVNLAVAAGLGYGAWRLAALKRMTPALSFVRGATYVAAAFLLLPWPCSLTGGAVWALWAGCGAH